MDTTERARPIMEYVRELEGKVQAYRSRDLRFNGRIFAMGFAAGAFAVSLVWLVRVFIHYTKFHP